MKLFSTFILTLALGFASTVYGSTCSDKLDTYDKYNEDISQETPKDQKSDYYVLSYSWAPGHCKKANAISKKPGGKNFIQCGSGRTFGYILHGLWPQGSLQNVGNYPRACEGDQPKIDRSILEKYLCMTPSVWLLQHEYEYHGTCMHDEALETPDKYFSIAQQLHSKLKLPNKELPDIDASYEWFVANNAHLTTESIQYYDGGHEWQFCYDNDFKVMECPDKPSNSTPDNCKIKGNISRSGKKYYFLPNHPGYAGVNITPARGERCFTTEAEAEQNGWTKAP